MPCSKIVLSYENPRYEAVSHAVSHGEHMDVGACDAIMEFHRRMESDMESKNVFFSRRLVDCRVCGGPISKYDIKFVDDHGYLILPSGDVELLPPGSESC